MYSRKFLNQIHKLSSTDMLTRSLLATIQNLIKLLKIVDADRKENVDELILTCLNFALKTIPCAPSPIFPKIVYCSITYVRVRIFLQQHIYIFLWCQIYCKNEKSHIKIFILIINKMHSFIFSRTHSTTTKKKFILFFFRASQRKQQIVF